jgi:hypothetical protein
MEDAKASLRSHRGENYKRTIARKNEEDIENEMQKTLKERWPRPRYQQVINRKAAHFSSPSESISRGERPPLSHLSYE